MILLPCFDLIDLASTGAETQASKRKKRSTVAFMMRQKTKVQFVNLTIEAQA